MVDAHTDTTMGGLVHDDGIERGRLLSEMADALRRLEHRQAQNRRVELIDPRSARRDALCARLKHWASPGVSTPWWVFIVRLGFWLLIGAGVQTASGGEGWHLDRVAAALGIAEVSWRAFGKLRARRRAGFRANAS
jgi:hypothetical protein